MTLQYLGLDPGTIAVSIPIVTILVIGLTIVVKVMTGHQRQMAELYRRENSSPDLIEEVRSLRSELAQVKDQLNQQTLLLDQTPVDSGKVNLQDRITER